MHPEITMHSLPLRFYLEAIDRDDWSGVARLLTQSVATLTQVGADVIICPNNTLHRAFDLVQSPVPWLHIAKPVVMEAAQRGWRRVGILGTQIVMEGSVYSHMLQQADIDTVIPEKDDRIRIQHIIRTELITGGFATKSRMYVQGVINRMKARGAQAVILGCTEMPLLLIEDQSVLPLLDSARLLARAALTYAISSHDHPMTQEQTVSNSHHLSHAVGGDS
jgi:aspartate racemase